MTTLEFKIPLYYFQHRFMGSAMKVHRMISNSQRKIGGVSNRSFWSKIKIKHRYFFSLSGVHFEYFVVEKIDQKLLRQFQIRIIITLGVPVRIIDNFSQS
jgi:hypothetical protein